MTWESVAAKLGPPFPPKLYHYTSAAAAYKILTSGQMWATDIRFLNDSREYELGKRLVAEPIRRCLADAQGWSAAQDTVDDWFRVHEPGAYVSSFTARGDLLSQWLAYCSRGGYALEFDPQALSAAAQTSIGATLDACIYEDADHDPFVQALVEHSRAELLEPPLAPDAPPGGAHLVRLRKALSTAFRVVLPRIKDGAFKAEEEWRLVVRDPVVLGPTMPRQTGVEYRAGSAAVIPYVVIPLRTGCVFDAITGARVAPSPIAELAQAGLVRLLNSLDLFDAADNVRLSEVPYRPLSH